MKTKIKERKRETTEEGFLEKRSKHKVAVPSRFRKCYEIVRTASSLSPLSEALRGRGVLRASDNRATAGQSPSGR